VKVVFLDENGVEYKTLHPPTGEVWVKGLTPGVVQVRTAATRYSIPSTHELHISETVGQQSAGG
jgi:hypothetical protein